MKQPVYDNLDPELTRKLGHFVREFVEAENLRPSDDVNRTFIDNISDMDGGLLYNNVAVSAECREKTRRRLARMRDGKAMPEEAKQITGAIMKMAEVGKKHPRSLLGRRAYVLTLRYLTPESVPLKIIALKLGLDIGTISHDIKIGIDKLSVLLFGNDDITQK